MIAKWNFIICFLMPTLFSLINCHRARLTFPKKRNLLMHHRMLARGMLISQVCYELVGCFADPPRHLSLKRPPEHPDVINTTFLLYTREDRRVPEILKYDDDLQSMFSSRFNASNPVKVFIHGYKGAGSDEGSVLIISSLLDVEDANVIVSDWSRGAGISYATAVANTELVGRQLALILLGTIRLGIDPKDIHMVGFSLGAHVAGCASEVLKKKNLLVGRITGLDPASPFFRHHLFRERSRKLDDSDARLVDVIHTDGSEIFTDGFGLLKPLGHMDFFPNGGREQPGCTDVKNSVVVTHLNEESLNKNIACSHLRAWQLFEESLRSQWGNCKFEAWPCPGGVISFLEGTCFPRETINGLQEMGYIADRGPRGIFYLATRAQSPYCGVPLRAGVTLSEKTSKTLGTLYFQIEDGNTSTIFRIQCDWINQRNKKSMYYNIMAADWDTFSGDEILGVIRGVAWYEVSTEKVQEGSSIETYGTTLHIDHLIIEDRKGNRWEFKALAMPINSRQTSVELYYKYYSL